MSFREFITKRLFRKRLQSEFESDKDEFAGIRPPKNPSRQYIERLVEGLLVEETCRRAERELELIGRPVIPVLVAVLDDPRFHIEYERSNRDIRQPMICVLGLLAQLSPDRIFAASAFLIHSPSSYVRIYIAGYYAASAREDVIPHLEILLNDDDGFVRSRVAIGVSRAITEGNAGLEFCTRMYDLILAQCDQEWNGNVNDAARVVVQLDPVRASVDFAAKRWWTPSNRYAYKILDVCNDAGIVLPAGPIRALLEHSLPFAVGKECYPHQYVVSNALVSLSRSLGDEIKPLIENLLDSDQEEIQESASKALALITGLENPVSYAFERMETIGYENLTRPQKHVICSTTFDSEVCNGGLMQFFGNSSGDHAVDTLDALRVIGPPEVHRVLDAAMKLVGPLSRESDRDLRLTAFENRYDELKERFEPLDTEFYRASGLHRQRQILYAVDNKEHFR